MKEVEPVEEEVPPLFGEEIVTCGMEAIVSKDESSETSSSPSREMFPKEDTRQPFHT